ncbi:MAG: GNAT family N-acetyltransferase [Bdellovibrionales bacterium]|nr:GNAT family N-acetyltransferase [Bdellovibrionales bacterium]
MEVTQLEGRDYEEFCKIMKKFYNYAGEPILDESSNRRLFDKAIDPNSNLIFLAAHEQSELCGIVSLTFGESSYKVAPFAYADDFFVCEEYRGQGVGKALVRKIREISQVRGCSNILLGVGNGEEASMKFYESNGLKICHAN